jgi:hypothetical protein
MREFFSVAALLAVNSVVACNSGAIDVSTPDGGGTGGWGPLCNGSICTGAGTGGASDDATSCQPGADLTGATYDLSKSRFAFGSTPVQQDASGMTRWVGVDGVVAIESCGLESGSMNGGAPESGLPDWSTDPATLSAHVRDYFLSMGVAPCQIANTAVLASGGAVCSTGPDASCEMTTAQRTIALARGVDGIPVSESNAYARFNVNDQSTSEGFYWPTVPAVTVATARSFRDQLADAAALAAYKARLPSDAQGDGRIVIHHSSCFGLSSSPFQSAATYDVMQSSSMGMASILSFDADGSPVTTSW